MMVKRSFLAATMEDQSPTTACCGCREIIPRVVLVGQPNAERDHAEQIQPR